MATQIKADRIVNSNNQEFAFEYNGVPEDGQGLVWDATKKLFVNAAVGVKAEAEATGGTETEITDGSGQKWKVHTFTDSSDFIVSGSELTDIEYLVIAGGGGNAANQGGNREAGSGAGGYRSSVQGEMSGGGVTAEPTINLAPGTYSVVVGSGASGHTQGSPSSFHTITTVGGGEGGNGDYNPRGYGGNGGSGGGTWYTGTGPGAGEPGQGYRGGYAHGGNNWTGGAGGGAGGAGSGSGDTSVGGPGVASLITGTSVIRAAGGRSNRYAGTSYNTSGAPNTGNGASGIGNGGSGIVIVRYKI